MKKLAEQGDAEAQFQLGRYYDNVDDAPGTRDVVEAVKWYCKAAEQNIVFINTNIDHF